MKNLVSAALALALLLFVGHATSDKVPATDMCNLTADGWCSVAYTSQGISAETGVEWLQFQPGVPQSGTLTLYKTLPPSNALELVKSWGPRTTPTPGDYVVEKVGGPVIYSAVLAGFTPATPAAPVKLFASVNGKATLTIATMTPTGTATFTPTSTPTPTFTPTNTPTMTPTSTPTPTPTSTPTRTPTPTNTPTSTPTNTPTVTPTATPAVHALTITITGTGIVDVTVGGIPQASCTQANDPCVYSGILNTAGVVLFAHTGGAFDAWAQAPDRGCDLSTNATCGFTMGAADVAQTAGFTP